MQTMRFPSSEVAAVGRRVMLVSGSSISKDWEIIIVALPIMKPSLEPERGLRLTPGRAGETQHTLVTEPPDYLTKVREHLYYVPAFFDP